ncbi:hypothetical protein C4588_08385 [Candidatus Parcubacteria bacterium]|nr:MAG: hypothetical protein C4588_08385 [Candidatus Parcubacteria bacterium]
MNKLFSTQPDFSHLTEKNTVLKFKEFLYLIFFLLNFCLLITDKQTFAQEYQITNVPVLEYSVDRYTNEIYYKNYVTGEIFKTNSRGNYHILTSFTSVPQFANNSHTAAYVDIHQMTSDLYLHDFEKDTSYFLVNSNYATQYILFSPSDNKLMVSGTYPGTPLVYYSFEDSSIHNTGITIYPEVINWISDSTLVYLYFAYEIHIVNLNELSVDTLVVAADTVTIRGALKDNDGIPIENATVTLCVVQCPNNISCVVPSTPGAFKIENIPRIELPAQNNPLSFFIKIEGYKRQDKSINNWTINTAGVIDIDILLDKLIPDSREAPWWIYILFAILSLGAGLYIYKTSIPMNESSFYLSKFLISLFAALVLYGVGSIGEFVSGPWRLSGAVVIFLAVLILPIIKMPDQSYIIKGQLLYNSKPYTGKLNSITYQHHEAEISNSNYGIYKVEDIIKEDKLKITINHDNTPIAISLDNTDVENNTIKQDIDLSAYTTPVPTEKPVSPTVNPTSIPISNDDAISDTNLHYSFYIDIEKPADSELKVNTYIPFEGTINGDVDYIKMTVYNKSEDYSKPHNFAEIKNIQQERWSVEKVFDSVGEKKIRFEAYKNATIIPESIKEIYVNIIE